MENRAFFHLRSGAERNHDCKGQPVLLFPLEWTGPEACGNPECDGGCAPPFLVLAYATAPGEFHRLAPWRRANVDAGSWISLVLN